MKIKDEYPQRCSRCDRINDDVEFISNTWKCNYCGFNNIYHPNSRFISNGRLPYVECMCGNKIRILSKEKGKDVICPECKVRLRINNSEMQVMGKNASEVLGVIREYLNIINQRNISEEKNKKSDAFEFATFYSEIDNQIDDLDSKSEMQRVRDYLLIINTIDKFFRTQFDNPPSNEKEVQEQLRKFFDANGYKQGVDYERESGKFHFSGREYIPDFVFKRINTALEVKLLKDKARKSIMIEEMNADCNAYSKEYKSLIFIVYDIGCISNVEEFKRDFEQKPNVRVLVIKH